MRELFINLGDEQKENIYQQLYKYIEDENLDGMLDVLKYKVNLAYKLKNFSSEKNGYLDDYTSSPLGMALYKDKKIIKELFNNCFLENLELHGPVYLYLAAKSASKNSVFFAKKLIELFFKNNLQLNLDFVVNDKVLDLDIIGKKDFIEIAIEENHEDFVDWVLDDKFIQTGVFVIKIHHIHNAIKNLNSNILKKILLKNTISLNEVIVGLEKRFLYVTTEIPYIEYISNFDIDLYHTIGELLFVQAVLQKNFATMIWLLKKGFFFEVKSTFYIGDILSDLQKKYPEDQLLFVGMHYKNYGLIQALLQLKKISIDNLIQYHLQNDCKINVELFEAISNYLYDFLFKIGSHKIWLDLIKITENSLYYRLFKFLSIYKQEEFLMVVQEMFEQNIDFILLEMFFKVIKREDYDMLDKFLLLPIHYKNFLLNGDDKYTALSIACENKSLDMVKILLQHMNVMQINKILNKHNYYKNITALWIALACNFTEGVRSLLNVNGISVETGKGRHYKFKNNVAISCRELQFLFGVENEQQSLGFYPLYHATPADCNYSNLMIDATSSSSPNCEQHLNVFSQLSSNEIELNIEKPSEQNDNTEPPKIICSM